MNILITQPWIETSNILGLVTEEEELHILNLGW